MGQLQQLTQSAKPVDWCTAWPDGIPTWLGGTGLEWQHCCKAHDLFYDTYTGWIGGYFASHWELAKCVASAGYGAMAAIMFGGLCTLGSVHLIWKYISGNRPQKKGK